MTRTVLIVVAFALSIGVGVWAFWLMFAAVVHRIRFDEWPYQ
jgi:hypothetical protein